MITPTPVDFIPGNIDGLKLYKLCNIQPKDCWKSAYDLRHFKMHTTRRKGFRGKIKVGFCSGNYVCKNDECPYRKSTPELKRNEQNWQYMEGRRECKHCSVWGTGKECGARKLVEYNTNLKEVIVYHLGKHTCTPRIDTSSMIML